MIHRAELIVDGDYPMICDVCDQPIQGTDPDSENSAAGIIAYQLPPEGRPFVVDVIYHVHRGDCDRQLRALVGLTWWRDSDTFVDQLAYNTKHPFRKDTYR